MKKINMKVIMMMIQKMNKLINQIFNNNKIQNQKTMILLIQASYNFKILIIIRFQKNKNKRN